MDDDNRTARWERRAGTPLAVASLLFLASYAVGVLGEDLPGPVRDLSRAVLYGSWALFIVDYAVRWRLSGEGPGFVHRHWLDSVVVVLPLLRPVRIVRVYDAMQARRPGEPRMTLQARVMLYAGLSSSLLGLSAALAEYHYEHNAPGASIRTFGDALWWSVATLSTVGYGDVVPVTVIGRLIAVVLMGCGLALLGAVTGSFSSYLMQRFARAGDDLGPRGK
ncbi:two pore domain potassium channel family protein [Streptomyces luteolifulvus]|jgi:voltage-gated potassium channel|uniref:Two pore domain potassium channel family protein n=1 Tax=Streptomyces luteolifulvus TaxID=2615112 RepID=A0A6H9V8H7_9ACTN|nr:potassium channel family protein [Streptomyces luteolifulvus]KAB1150724.1 two pore domain potassium channel family protein [Streptomyces luteolifulvus]